MLQKGSITDAFPRALRNFSEQFFPSNISKQLLLSLNLFNYCKEDWSKILWLLLNFWTTNRMSELRRCSLGDKWFFFFTLFSGWSDRTRKYDSSQFPHIRYVYVAEAFQKIRKLHTNPVAEMVSCKAPFLVSQNVCTTNIISTTKFLKFSEKAFLRLWWTLDAYKCAKKTFKPFNPFHTKGSFYTPQKTRGFLMFSGDMKKTGTKWVHAWW